MRINKSAILATAFLTAAVLAGAPSSASAAADVPGLEIGDEVGYNAVGPDRSWNRNSEWVDVKNTSDVPVDVKGLVVEDSWRHAQPADTTTKCNRWTVNTLPGVDEDAGKLMLPARHTIRVYSGSGTPKVFGPSASFHAVYMNSDVRCGYHGHFWNNNAPKGNRFGPWDTIWIVHGTASQSKSYGFRFGFTAPLR